MSASVATACETCSTYSSAASASSLDVDLGREHAGEPLAQRPRRARARRELDVVRNRRPEAHRRDARAPAGVEQHADDPGRPLVARELQAELVDELRVGRRTGHGSRVACAARRRAARRASRRARRRGRARGRRSSSRERPPAVVRLDADEQDRVAVRPGNAARGRTCSRATRSSASAPPRARPSAASPGSRRRAPGRCRRTSRAPHSRAR